MLLVWARTCASDGWQHLHLQRAMVPLVFPSAGVGIAVSGTGGGTTEVAQPHESHETLCCPRDYASECLWKGACR